jgi:hypothetical protein
VALEGFLAVAKMIFGGEGNLFNCLTNSNPMPLLAPVTKTDDNDILYSRWKSNFSVLKGLEKDDSGNFHLRECMQETRKIVEDETDSW